MNLYTKEMRKNGVDVKVEEVGLLVPKEKPYLGASIDRIVTFKDTEEKWGIKLNLPSARRKMEQWGSNGIVIIICKFKDSSTVLT